LRLRHSQHWRLLQDLPVQSIPMILMLHVGRGVTGMLVASGESSPSVSSRLAPSTHDRPSDPARSSCGVSCPGRASWPALHYHMRADVKIGAVKAQAQKHWRRLQRFELISNVVTGILSLTVKNKPSKQPPKPNPRVCSVSASRQTSMSQCSSAEVCFDRRMHRKPMWLIPVSIICGWRAAGR